MLLMGEEIVETGARRQGSRKPLDISIWERGDKSSNKMEISILTLYDCYTTPLVIFFGSQNTTDSIFTGSFSVSKISILKAISGILVGIFLRN